MKDKTIKTCIKHRFIYSETRTGEMAKKTMKYEIIHEIDQFEEEEEEEKVGENTKKCYYNECIDQFKTELCHCA